MFRLFGVAHFAGLAVTAIWAFLLYRMSAQDSKTNRIFSIISGLILLSFYFIFAGIEVVNGTFSLAYHLPLQISNFILFFTGLGLLFKQKIWYTLIMFWALPGALISVSFPDINRTFPSNDYLFFWLSHAILLGFVIFVFHYRQFTLELGDLFLSQAILLLYVAVVYPLNMMLGSNYGYLERLPGSVSFPAMFTSPPAYIPLMFVVLSALALIVLYAHNYLKQMISTDSHDVKNTANQIQSAKLG